MGLSGRTSTGRVYNATSGLYEGDWSLRSVTFAPTATPCCACTGSLGGPAQDEIRVMYPGTAGVSPGASFPSANTSVADLFPLACAVGSVGSPVAVCTQDGTRLSLSGCSADDECDSLPCQNSAACIDGSNSYTCSCTNGYEGDNCAIDADECASAPCRNGAVCTESGTNGSGGDGVPGGDGDPTGGGGDPTGGGGGGDGVPGGRRRAQGVAGGGSVPVGAYSCACMDGYASGMCAYAEIVPGYEQQCALADSNAGNQSDGNCAVDVDECASAPCQNSAVCYDHVSDWQCDCITVFNTRTGQREAHTGETCNQTINVCAVNEDDCDPFHATCHHTGPGHHDCTCHVGWMGDGRTCTDVNECVSTPCQNGAVCYESGCAVSAYPNGTACSIANATLDGTPTAVTAASMDAYSCLCPAGFANGACGYALDPSLSVFAAACGIAEGGNCDVDVNECVSNPCQNGGGCSESRTSPMAPADSYICTCLAGFGGPSGNCDLDLDECSSSPCMNGAPCTDSTIAADVPVDAYRCTCIGGYANGVCGYAFAPEYQAECSIVDSISTDQSGSGNCDLQVSAMQCPLGTHQENDLCEPNVCTCERSTPAVESSCFFQLPGGGGTVPTAYDTEVLCLSAGCTFVPGVPAGAPVVVGTPATGAACTVDGANICGNCSAGFHRGDDTTVAARVDAQPGWYDPASRECVENICSCAADFGTMVQGSAHVPTGVPSLGCANPYTQFSLGGTPPTCIALPGTVPGLDATGGDATGGDATAPAPAPSAGCPCIGYPWAGSAAFVTGGVANPRDITAETLDTVLLGSAMESCIPLPGTAAEEAVSITMCTLTPADAAAVPAVAGACTGPCTYVAFSPGTAYAYPTSYGMDSCLLHDAAEQPYCADANGVLLPDAPAWCQSLWCFVDATNCDVANDPASYFAGSTPALHYSYEACGGDATGGTGGGVAGTVPTCDLDPWTDGTADCPANCAYTAGVPDPFVGEPGCSSCFPGNYLDNAYDSGFVANWCKQCSQCGAGTYALSNCNATANTVCGACPAVANAAPGTDYTCNPLDGTASLVSACGTGFYKAGNQPGAGGADTCVACSTCAPGTFGAPCTSAADTSCSPCPPVANGDGALTCANATTSRMTSCSPGYTLVPGTAGTADGCAPSGCPNTQAFVFSPDPQNPQPCNAGGHPGGAGYMQACNLEEGCSYRGGQCLPLEVSAPGSATSVFDSSTEVTLPCADWLPRFSGDIVFRCELGVLTVDRNTCVDVDECASAPCQNGGVCTESGTLSYPDDVGYLRPWARSGVGSGSYTCSCQAGYTTSCRHGCTDPAASNFDPAATYDDGSCLAPPGGDATGSCVDDDATILAMGNPDWTTCAEYINWQTAQAEPGRRGFDPCAASGQAAFGLMELATVTVAEVCGCSCAAGDATGGTGGDTTGGTGGDATGGTAGGRRQLQAAAVSCDPSGSGNCDLDIDECSSGPCQNSGNCSQLVDSYTCGCVEGWSDGNCTTQPACTGNPCGNGNCTNTGPSTYDCVCDVGYNFETDLMAGNSSCVFWEKTGLESIGVYSTLVVEGDITTVSSASMRAQFELAFTTAMADALGPAVLPEDLIVDEIAAGSIVVSFHLNAPLASTAAAMNMIAALATSGQTIEIRTNSRVYQANTATLVPSGLQCDVIQEFNCTVGHFLDDQAVCNDCASGQYDDDWDFNTPCVACAPGYTSAAASTSCVARQCTLDTIVSRSSTTCSGTTGGICTFQCNEGYTPTGLHFCGTDRRFKGGSCDPADCSAGLTIPDSPSRCAGATNDMCVYSCNCGFKTSGTHLCQTDGNFTGGSCVSCGAGKASSGTSNTCTQCADGKEPSVSQCDCDVCAPGTAGAGGQCSACAVGRSPSLDQTVCDECAAGRASNDGISCTKCPLGSFSASRINCTQSQAGYRPSATGMTEELCPPDTAGAGGVCTPCGPGETSNPLRTACTACPRLRYKPAGEGCIACDTGSVPNRDAGATFCVSCALENTPTVASARYADVDWPACLMSSVICNPGEQPSDSLTSCVPCSQVGNNAAQSASLFSASGTSCDSCAPGKQPSADRSACDLCIAGTYSSTGVCDNCTTQSNSFSGPGATQCDACGPGTRPATDRGSCESCPPGQYSPYGSCQACAAGKQPSDAQDSCVDCATISSTAFSPDGRTCQVCAVGTQPSVSRDSCDSCPGGTLGSAAGCVGACAAVGCVNITVGPDTGEVYATVSSLTLLCSNLPTWVADTSGSVVHSTDASCTEASCNVRAAFGSTIFAISATAGGLSASCPLEVFVKEARIEVTPSVTIDSLGTSYGEATLRISNAGDDPVSIFDVVFPDTYITVDSVVDQTSLSVTLPAPIAPQGSDLHQNRWILN